MITLKPACLWTEPLTICFNLQISFILRFWVWCDYIETCMSVNWTVDWNPLRSRPNPSCCGSPRLSRSLKISMILEIWQTLWWTWCREDLLPELEGDAKEGKKQTKMGTLTTSLKRLNLIWQLAGMKENSEDNYGFGTKTISEICCNLDGPWLRKLGWVDQDYGRGKMKKHFWEK